MQSIGEKIKQYYSEIINFQKTIIDINELINNSLKQLKQYNERFNSHLQFNKDIFNLYQENKRNYYILSTFNSLDFNSEDNFLKKDKNIQQIYKYMNKLNNKIELKINQKLNIFDENKENIENKFYDNGKNNETKFINMWISEKYCKVWGLREAIREFMQNQFDGIITSIQSKKNLRVEKNGKEYTINGRKKCLDYNFININEGKIYGEIKYDNESNILYISNEGEILLADFLLGGSKDEESNSEIIGTFGEGMKLAILALCRLEKNVTIFSSNKKYSFAIKEDNNFVKNSQVQKCLHCKIEEYYNHNLKGKVMVKINNINEDEWGNQIDNYLWLLGNDIEIYTSLNDKGEEIGEIIFEDYLKGKIFVKGIYVQESELSDNDRSMKKDIPGLNTTLKLDRDRNCVQSKYELKSVASGIISGTFNKNVEYLKNTQENTGYTFIKTKYGFERCKEDNNDNSKYEKDNAELKNLTKNLVGLLEKEVEIINYYELGFKLSPESIDVIWNEMDMMQGDKNRYPTNDVDHIIQFLNEKKLPKEFYLYYKVSYDLSFILKKSENYKSIEKKFEEYAEKTESVEPNKEYKEALKSIYSKLKTILPDFNENIVVFKNFPTTDKDFCFKNAEHIIFCSKKLEEELNNEWKFWIFIKILNTSEIKIEDSYKLFNQIFTEEEKKENNNSLYSKIGNLISIK